jgi:hypothetical protein
MEATRSSETSVYNKPTRRHIPERDILHIHRSVNLKSYTIFALVCRRVTAQTVSGGAMGIPQGIELDQERIQQPSRVHHRERLLGLWRTERHRQDILLHCKLRSAFPSGFHIAMVTTRTR